ncbi:MAG: HU family DNA-binding protein [Candidatus Kapaibacterium sp.]|jgi:nucleoid DNA-binding protein
MAPREKKSDNVTKAELVDRISEETGLTKLEVKTVVEGFINGILSSMSERRRIEIRGFGVFSVKSRKPRMARNPRTGDSVELKARYAPVFKASNDFIAEVDAKIKSRTEKNS